MNGDMKPSSSSITQETQENVLRLNQKLRGLLVEIEAKMETYDLDPSNAQNQNRKQQMQTLHTEVAKAITSIKTLVQVMSGNDPNSPLLKMSEKELSSFRDLIKESVERITKMKEEF